MKMLSPGSFILDRFDYMIYQYYDNNNKNNNNYYI